MADLRSKVSAMNEKNYELRVKKAEVQESITSLEEVIATSQAKLEELRAKSQRLAESISQNEAAQVDLFYGERDAVARHPAPNTAARLRSSSSNVPRRQTANAIPQQSSGAVAKRPGFMPCPVSGRAAISDNDHIKHTNSSRLIFSADHPTIVKLDRGWAEIWCHVCGANTIATRHIHFTGLQGLCVHLQRSHKEQYRNFSVEDVLDVCGIYYLTEEEVLSFRHHRLEVRKFVNTGQESARPLTQTEIRVPDTGASQNTLPQSSFANERSPSQRPSSESTSIARRPGFVSCRGEITPIRPQDHVKAYGGPRAILSYDQSAIVRLDRGWAEVWCHVCGANYSAFPGSHFSSLKGLSDHVRRAHGTSYLGESIFWVCGIYYLTEEEYAAFCQGKLRLNKVSSLRGQSHVQASPRATTAGTARRPASSWAGFTDDEFDEPDATNATQAPVNGSRPGLFDNSIESEDGSESEGSEVEVIDTAGVKRRRIVGPQANVDLDEDMPFIESDV